MMVTRFLETCLAAQVLIATVATILAAFGLLPTATAAVLCFVAGVLLLAMVVVWLVRG